MWTYKKKEVLFLEKAFSGETSERINKHWKDIVKHSKKVYNYLINFGVQREIYIAWLLHDVLEDTSISYEQIKDTFWEKVANLVLSCTKNIDIEKSQRNFDVIKKCKEYWFEALLIKAFDNLDSYLFYKKIWNTLEIQRCIRIKELFLMNIDKENLRKLKFILNQIQ